MLRFWKKTANVFTQGILILEIYKNNSQYFFILFIALSKILFLILLIIIILQKILNKIIFLKSVL